jgi:hypothetical protein
LSLETICSWSYNYVTKIVEHKSLVLMPVSMSFILSLIEVVGMYVNYMGA